MKLDRELHLSVPSASSGNARGKSAKAFSAGGLVALLVFAFAGHAFGNKKPKFAYVANQGSNSVSAYTIDNATGALSPVPGSPFAAGTNPSSVAVDTSGKFAYVANLNSNDVSAYTIDINAGALSPVPGSPFAAGVAPFWVAVDPSSHFVFVANGCGASCGTVSAYTIDNTTGALSPVPGSPFAAGTTPSSVAVDPSGKFAFVANSGSTTVSAYMIDSTTGALTPVPGSPFAAGMAPYSVVVEPSGAFAYVANSGSGTVSAYRIDSAAGTLSPVPGSPFAAGVNPLRAAVDPSGQFAYVVGGVSDISAYTIDSTTGALSPVPGSPFAAGTNPFGVAVDPSGKFTYVANYSSDDVSAYIIDSATGALRLVPGSPFAAGAFPFSVAVAGQSTVPFAILRLMAEIDLDRKASFEVEGHFSLGVGSNGISPPSEDVNLRVATFSTTIPAGSFIDEGRGTFEFKGFINGMDLKVVIHRVGGDRFLFTADGAGANLIGTMNPVTVELSIGDDDGSTTVTAQFD